MKDEIKQLLYSYNEDDIKLGLHLAFIEGVKARELNEIFDNYFYTDYDRETGINYMNIYDLYLRRGKPYKKGNSFDYNSWRRKIWKK